MSEELLSEICLEALFWEFEWDKISFMAASGSIEVFWTLDASIRRLKKVTISPLLYEISEYSETTDINCRYKLSNFFNLRDWNLRPCPGRSFTLPNILSSSVPKISNYNEITRRCQISDQNFLKNIFFWVRYQRLDSIDHIFWCQGWTLNVRFQI